MSLTTIHTFDTADQRARFAYDGIALRAVEIRTDENGELWIFAIRVTKRGSDYKSGTGFWLTLTNTLDRREDCAGIAAYARELTAVPDRNDTPITRNANVEYRTYNPDGAEVDGLRGRVDDIGSDGMVGVEWESAHGEVQWHCPSVLLVVA